MTSQIFSDASSFSFVFMGCVVCGDKATVDTTQGDRTKT